jgi:ribulose-5-phosphate 4-epimerase/fuculose-1-phosphate aldolase
LKFKDGIEEIPIEERESEEVRYIQGLHNGSIVDVLLTPEKSPAANYGFDVTPARLVTGLITERGICEPSEEGILKLFPEIRGSKESGSRVRFVTEFISDEVPRNPRLEELKYWCRQFHENNLTPLYENASVGNLSFRVENGKNSFIITASAINSKYELPDSCFVKVSSCEIEKSKVYAYGNRKPSSESMLHYAIYIQRPDVNAIFHGHCQEILNSGNKFGIPETSKEEPFGSMELIQRTLEVLEKNKNVNFFLLKNHGFVSLGRTMKDAGELALEMYKKCCE